MKRKFLDWAILTSIFCSSAIAETTKQITINNSTSGSVSTITDPNLPNTIEIQNNVFSNPMSYQWTIKKTLGHTAPIGTTVNRTPNFSAPSGWQIVKVNEDQTLALIIPNSTYTSTFLNGCLIAGKTLRVYPVQSNISTLISQIKTKAVIKQPSRNVIGTNYEMIVNSFPFKVADNETLNIAGDYDGPDKFVLRTSVGSNSAIYNLNFLTTTFTPHRNYFTDDPSGRVFNDDLNWDLNFASNDEGIIRCSAVITIGNQTIERAICIPISNLILHCNYTNCDLITPIPATVMHYDGNSVFNVAGGPSVSSTVVTSNGIVDIQVPNGWRGKIWCYASECNASLMDFSVSVNKSYNIPAAPVLATTKPVSKPDLRNLVLLINGLVRCCKYDEARRLQQEFTNKYPDYADQIKSQINLSLYPSGNLALLFEAVQQEKWKQFYNAKEIYKKIKGDYSDLAQLMLSGVDKRLYDWSEENGLKRGCIESEIKERMHKLGFDEVRSEKDRSIIMSEVFDNPDYIDLGREIPEQAADAVILLANAIVDRTNATKEECNYAILLLNILRAEYPKYNDRIFELTNKIYLEHIKQNDH